MRLLLLQLFALTGISLGAMELPVKKTNKIVNLARVFSEAADFFYSEDEFTARNLFRLLNHVKVERLPEIFLADCTAVNRYLHLDQAKKLIKLCVEEDVFDENYPKKIKALKNCFNLSECKKLVGCQDIDTIVITILDLYCLDDDLEARNQKLVGLKKDLDAIDQNNSLIKHFFNLEDIKAIIDDILVQKPVEKGRIVATINAPAFLDMVGFPQEEVECYFITTEWMKLLLSDSESILKECMLRCIRWDAVAELILSGIGFDEYFINLPKLKVLLKNFQAGKPVTRNALLEIVHFKVLNELGVDPETVLEVVDFGQLAQAMNAWRNALDNPCNNTEKINVSDTDGESFSESEELVSLPEQAFAVQLNTTLESLTAPVCTVAQYAAPLLALWLSGHALCHPCMELLEQPLAWVPNALFWPGMLCALSYGADFFKEPTLESVIVCNTARTKVKEFFGSKDEFEKLLKDIRSHIPQHPYAQEFDTLLNLLTAEHIALLPNPYTILDLLEDPFTFVDTYQKFIIGLCTIDSTAENKKAAIRLTFIWDMFKKYSSARGLAIKNEKIYNEFANAAVEYKELLADPNLLQIAQYRPKILLTQTEFMRKVNQVNPKLVFVLYLLIEASTQKVEKGI